MEERSQLDELAAVASIQGPLRRSLFEFVSASDEPIGRDEAAEALGIARGTAAFHLDRLVESGVLSVEFKRRSGKTGPGSGRPAKLYRRAAGEFTVSIPERHYDLVGDILAAAIEESDRSGIPVRDALTKAATERGHDIGARVGSLRKVLELTGYEPRDDGTGSTILANCPFHRLAASHTAIICEANLCVLQGPQSARATTHTR